MRVCHICSNYDKFFSNLMEQQLAKGIDLRVFYFRAKERGWPDVNSSYVDVRLNYSNWSRPFFYLKEKSVLSDFFQLYRKEDFDINHAHTLFSNGYIALKAKEKWGTPYIVAVRDMDVNIFFRYRRNLRALGMEILSEAEKIIFLSDSYKKHVLLNYIPSVLRNDFNEKSVVIPNGVDPFYLENKQEKFKINQEENNKEFLEIITVGYVGKRKNQLAVCKAVDQLNKEGIATKYTIIGKVLDGKIFDQVKKYPFTRYIPFLSKEELVKEYRKADIFVMPSVTETFGLTYVEALSQGLPIIYSRGQGFDGQFEEGEVGYAVENTNPIDIKNKIMKIKENYHYISKKCTESSDKFNWRDIETEYSRIYKSISMK
ncbi:glycosyltransferase family 4 protein [Bacillus haikouensis]|nr:glycosyltransferase family 4 protein [Bacillus haikouensis]